MFTGTTETNHWISEGVSGKCQNEIVVQLGTSVTNDDAICLITIVYYHDNSFERKIVLNLLQNSLDMNIKTTVLIIVIA